MAHVFIPRIFEPPVPSTPVDVTITGVGSSICSVTIDGTTYTSEVNGIQVSPGDVVTFKVRATMEEAVRTTYVSINGVKVATASDTNSVTYAWTVPENVSNIQITLYKTALYGNITVTTS